MNKQIAHVPLEQISRLEIVVTKCRKSLTEVKGETGADYILNGGMWNPDGSACVGLKAGGRLLSRTPWGNVHGSLDGSYKECEFTQKLYPGQEHLLKITCSLLNKGDDAHCLILTH